MAELSTNNVRIPISLEPPANAVSFAALDADRSLPTPVRRYFKAVLKDGQPLVQSARMTQRGVFRLGDKWKPFDAEETMITHPPEFFWDARIHMYPLLTVRVRDSYAQGRGKMKATMFGIRIVDEHDRRELDAGALHRYLAEAPWVPTALVPREGLTWTAVDDSHAIATLADGKEEVSVEFTFALTGEILSMFVPNRYFAEKGSYVPRPWGVTCKRFEERCGMRIPIEGEVYWKINGEIMPYWRGEITDVKYEFIH
jgi:hypothetical protein